jgi:hypothetical protein
VAAWFWHAVVAAMLYGAHQIFTRLPAERIGEGLGGFVVEASTAVWQSSDDSRLHAQHLGSATEIVAGRG